MEVETIAIKREVRDLTFHITIKESGTATKLQEVSKADDTPVLTNLNIESGCPACSCVLNVNIFLHDDNESNVTEESLVPITILHDIKSDQSSGSDNDEWSDDGGEPRTFINLGGSPEVLTVKPEKPLSSSLDHLSQEEDDTSSSEDSDSEKSNNETPLLKCCFCEKSISSNKQKLRKHLKTKHADEIKLAGDKNCPICSQLVSAVSLDFHIKYCGDKANRASSEHHSSEILKPKKRKRSDYVCLYCYEELTSYSTYMEHLTNHSLVCRFCERSYKTLHSLSQHLRKNHSDLRKKLKQFVNCSICDELVLDIGYKRHFNACRASENDVKQEEEKTDPTDKFFEELKKNATQTKKKKKKNSSADYVCLCCYEPFQQRSNYYKHMVNHSLVCKFCNRSTYTSFKTLSRHVRTHHGDLRPDVSAFVECPRCGEKIMGPAVKRHFRTCKANEKGKPHCGICKKEFAVWKSVLPHVTNVHMGLKQYTCDICGAQFGQHESMKNHLIRHELNDPKPYKCDLCYKQFTIKPTLARHMESEHIMHNEPQPVFPCDICGINIKTLKGLKTHKRRHSENKRFHCSFCGKGFIHNAELINHERSHNGDRPFPCTYCELRFTAKSALQSHIRLHTGDKPYECEICHSRFSDRGFYRSHMIKHERELGVVLDKSVKKFRMNYRRPEPNQIMTTPTSNKTTPANPQ